MYRFVLLAVAACSHPAPLADAGESSSDAAEPAADAAELDATQAKINQARAHISKVFVLVKENRTFDHYFGDLPGADTSLVANTTAHGAVPLTAMSGAMSAEDHGHDSAMTAWNGGAMNGWDLLADYPANRLTYYPGELPSDPLYPYHQLAKSYAILDHFHTEILGPSIPNHLSIVSGLAEVYDNCNGCTIGCAGTGVAPVLDTSCMPTTKSACFAEKSVVDLLPLGSWRGYGGKTGGGQIQSPLLNFQTTYAKIDASHLRADTALLADLRASDLAEVTFVDYIKAACDADGEVPGSGKCSEEPGADPCYGENWTTNVIAAIAAANGGKTWYDPATGKGAVILVTWDDWGGVYDHVAPQTVCNGYSQGMRVPMLVISPFAKTGVVSAGASFGAIPRLVEDVFANSTRLGGASRDMSDGDLLAAFDFSQPAKPAPVSRFATCQ
jgi:phospholipase C